MTGRKFFELFHPAINALSIVFSIFPAFAIRFLWSLIVPFSGPVSVLLRYCLVAKKFESAGKNVYFGSSVILKNHAKAAFGSNVSVHDFCYLDARGGISIGDNVSIAHGCSIITFNHTWGDPHLPIKYNPVSEHKVIIEDDVWIGCGVRIMPGVRIGNRSVVAAGSVVTKDVAPGTIVAGVPAKFMKKIDS